MSKIQREGWIGSKIRVTEREDGSKIREKERERINSLAISRNKSILGKQKVMSPEENLDSLSKMICSFHFYRLKEINKKYIPEKYENNHFVAVFYKCGFNRCKRA